MDPFPLRGLLPVALVLAALSANAQPAAKLNSNDPANPQAQVPLLTHRSALAGYRRQADDPAVPWKEANERVARIGGWRAYAREAAASDAAGTR